MIDSKTYEITKIDDMTYAFSGVLPDDCIVRFYLLLGEKKNLLIDSGFLNVDIKALVSDMSADHEVPVPAADISADHPSSDDNIFSRELILINTHGDFDHTAGNVFFDSFYMTAEDYEKCHIKELCPDSRCIPVFDDMQIDLGGRIIKVIETPGHTYGSISLLDVTNRILFPGDMVQDGTMFMFGEHRAPRLLAGSLKKLAAAGGFDKIYTSHGSVILKPEDINKVYDSWQQLLSKSVVPVKAEALGQIVNLYNCSFCNFFTDCSL